MKMKIRNMKDKRDTLVIAGIACSLSATFFIFGPIQLYISNITELWFSIWDMLFVCLGTGILAAVIIFLCGTIIPSSRLRSIYCCILLGLCIALYIQGNYVLTDYGVLDGREIAWEQYRFTAIWDTALWLVCLTIPFAIMRFSRIYKKVFIYITGAITLVQMVSLVVVCMTANLSGYQSGDYYLSKKNLYTVSSGENIVVFVLDTYDQRVFDDILKNDPNFFKPLDGFTYFRNMTCAYPTTQASLPYILTGQYYENEQEYTDYINEAFSNCTYFEAMKNADYSLDLYTNDFWVSDDAKKRYFDNGVEGHIEISSKIDLERAFLRLTAFRYFPHVAKKYVWFYGGIFDSLKVADGEADKYVIDEESNLDFFKGLKELKLQFNEEKKAFRFIHLFGAHPPYNLNEDVTPAMEIVSPVIYSKAALNIVYEYISQLKNLGIYDNTLIIITSDHGVVTDSANLYMPILLAKRFGEFGPMKFSNVPVSHGNLFATIFSEGIMDETNIYGKSIYDIDEKENTERRYLYYTWNGEHKNGYMPDMIEYSIAPENNDISCFLMTGKVFTSAGIHVNNPYSYQIGDKIRFSQEENGKHYFLSGISNEENETVWSSGYTSRMYLTFEEEQNEMTANIKLAGIYGNTQHVIIKSDEKILFDANVTNESREIHFTVPRECIQDGKLQLDFEYPDACSPKSKGESNDDRILALKFYEIQFVS